MIAAGISTRPLGTIPVSAIVHDERAAANPRRKPGAKVSKNPLTPMVTIASSATTTKARRLCAKIASPSSSAAVWLTDRTRLERTGRTTDVGIAPVEPAR